MKNLSFVTGFILACGIGANVGAQQVAPPGAGDKGLEDRSVKGRSVEIERIRRDAANSKKTSKKKDDKQTEPEIQPEDRSELDLKYPEIKEDFEGIQMSYDAIIKAYRPDAAIDYRKIVESAATINKHAARLNANLFPKSVAEKTDALEEKEPEKKHAEKTLRALIVELDSAVGNLTGNTIFQNLRAPDPNESAKAETELKNIVKVSDLLGKKAGEKIN